MPSVTFECTQNGIEARLNTLVTKMKSARAFLNTTMYKIYLEAQKARWESENESETGRWAPLSTRPVNAWWLSTGIPANQAIYYAYQEGGYAAAKKYLYAGFPGGGNAMMVATSKLYMAAIFESTGGNKVVTETSLEISIDDGQIPYAKYAALKRPFMNFGSRTQDKIRQEIVAYFGRKY